MYHKTIVRMIITANIF